MHALSAKYTGTLHWSPVRPTLPSLQSTVYTPSSLDYVSNRHTTELNRPVSAASSTAAAIGADNLPAPVKWSHSTIRYRSIFPSQHSLFCTPLLHASPPYFNLQTVWECRQLPIWSLLDCSPHTKPNAFQHILVHSAHMPHKNLHSLKKSKEEIQT